MPVPPAARRSRTIRSNPSSFRDDSAFTESPYSVASESRLKLNGSSFSEKYSLSPDPRLWGSNLSPSVPEPDDAIHNPSVNSKGDRYGLNARGLANVGCLAILCTSILALFVGYPITSAFLSPNSPFKPGFNFGGAGTNASGQVPSMGNFGLIDLDTPPEAYTKVSSKGGDPWRLVFSDEFNKDGRTFYPGDDPYWEAEDLYYWATMNKEWYDPEAVTTQGGQLVIRFSEKRNHNLDYQGGLITSWNKFCFTGGLIEVSVQLPGPNNAAGMWPAVWTLGNLGRAGYGASLDGMWPYSYDTCDVGTVNNQTKNGLPFLATVEGDPDDGHNNELSWLPGQKLSRCTCPGESHPGPVHADGTYVGRSAPEIDIIEAQMGGNPKTGEVSQSAQFAPFNYKYVWDYADGLQIYNKSISILNSFKGSATQMATSVVTKTDLNAYELGPVPTYSVYSFEYKPGYDDAYITWVSNSKPAWTFLAGGVGPDPNVEIGARTIPGEPLYIIMNLGMSVKFGAIDFDQLSFPVHLRIDYVRVYQPPNAINIGCDPPDFPTAKYINTYIGAYTNTNYTVWSDIGQSYPKNKWKDEC